MSFDRQDLQYLHDIARDFEKLVVCEPDLSLPCKQLLMQAAGCLKSIIRRCGGLPRPLPRPPDGTAPGHN